jgi:hypothetical protein
MFENLWINRIHPQLKEIVLKAKENKKYGVKIFYRSGMVIINYGPLAVRGYDAKTGALIMMS